MDSKINTSYAILFATDLFPPNIEDENSNVTDENPGTKYYFAYANRLAFRSITIAILSVGIMANIWFVLVYLGTKRLKKTVFDYLLFVSLCDVLFLSLDVPSRYFDAFESGVYILSTYFASTAQYCSLITVTFISIERYVQICQPVKHLQSRYKDKNKIAFCVFFWILATLVTIPENINTSDYYNPIESINQFALGISVLSIYFLMHTFSLVTVSYAYCKITGVLKKRLKQRRLGRRADSNQIKVVNMLIANTVVYFLCTFPRMLSVLFHIYLLVIYYQFSEVPSQNFYHFQEYFSGAAWMFQHINSSINPIIYMIYSPEFRRATQDIIKNCRRESQAKDSTTKEILEEREEEAKIDLEEDSSGYVSRDRLLSCRHKSDPEQESSV